MNPSPCGYYGSVDKPCTCAQTVVTKYQKHISGPLLDRIDIHIEVPCVDYEKLSGDRLSESSTSICARVQTARDCSPIFLSTLSIVVYHWVVCR
ncbi:MAG: ATP-binding protein [Anaerolineales bacterium]|nr:ATP-binding protein [Anaerolineales bacterium]